MASESVILHNKRSKDKVCCLSSPVTAKLVQVIYHHFFFKYGSNRLDSLLEHLIFLNFLGEDPNPLLPSTNSACHPYKFLPQNLKNPISKLYVHPCMDDHKDICYSCHAYPGFFVTTFLMYTLQTIQQPEPK